MTTTQTVSVVGLGYIGLPTAAMFASRGVEVIGVDICEKIVDTINRGEIHIVEPALDLAVRSAVAAGYLRASAKPLAADAFLIAVPTPLHESDHQPDVEYIKKAALSIAPLLQVGNQVILESTSPVGTTELLATWLADMRADLSFPQTAGEDSDIRIAYCPERVLPGNVMRELVENDRLIGGMTEKCSAVAAQLYKIFVTGDCVETNTRTAEMAKLTENSFRDVNIAFANELSVICDQLDINTWELISLVNRHPRVNVLQPGPGVGGHCIAVDPWFIISTAPKNARLIRTARQVNEDKPRWVIEKVCEAIQCCLAGSPTKTESQITVACYGLTFKPDIDDLRESPALRIVNELCEMHSGTILAVEPNIDQAAPLESGAKLVDLAEAHAIADVHVLLVDHDDFRKKGPPLGKLVDTRGIW